MKDRVGRFGALLFVLADGLFWATLFYLVVFHRLYVHDSRVEEYIRRTGPWPDVPPAQRIPTAMLLAGPALTWITFALDAARRRVLALAACAGAFLFAVGVLAWAAKHGLPFDRGRYGLVVHGLGTVWAAHLALACVLLFVRARDRAQKASPSRRLDPLLLLFALAGTGCVLVLT